MTVVDARIRVHHPCPYCDISAEFPRTLLLLWCDNRRDVFLVSSPDSTELRRVVAALRASFHARPLLVDGRDALVVVPDFEWPDPPSVTGLARKAGVWVLHPVVYFDGTESYRFVAPTKSELNRLVTRLRRLGAVELLSVSDRTNLSTVRDSPVASVHFFEGLTERQARSLVAAYEGGLFDVPSRTSWDEVAGQEGLSRSTFGEHLRKGQLRLLTNSYASLKARTEGPSEPVVLPSLRPTNRVVRAPLQGTRPN
ncbi:MAG: helix-turn-helix domain-containing protein [Thermoplasmata archaeon]